MIVETSSLPNFRRRVAMVDGGFDPLHAGHVDYFEEAAKIGLPVLCNVASDEYVRSKHPPLLPEEQRVRLIDSIRYIDMTHLSRSTTEAVLRELQPRYYVKGADWRGRLPKGELAACEELGIEIVFLDTVSDSSTAIWSRCFEHGAGREASM
jgi:cytidyltransferase-like protein